jgi:hypothetical protein
MGTKQFLKGPYARAISAVEKGDREEAIRQIRELNESSTQVHDRLVKYVNLLLSFIAREVGEEKVREAWCYVIERLHKKGLLALKGRPFREIVKVLQDEHLAHGSEFTMEEDPDKATFALYSCGSGGRLRKTGSSGIEGELQSAHPWSFGRKGLSYYCSHCSIVTEDSPNWDAGFKIQIKYGEQFDKEGTPVADPCRFEIIRTKTKLGGKED